MQGTSTIEWVACDHADEILALLDRLSTTISPTFFLQNIFLILISAPSSRLGALSYLSRIELPPLDPGLIIRGVAGALGDDNMLVRRSALDLLVRVVPLNGENMR
jgi:hypothetical protein